MTAKAKPGMRERLRRMELEVEHFLFRHQCLHAQLDVAQKGLAKAVEHLKACDAPKRAATVEAALTEVQRLEVEWQERRKP